MTLPFAASGILHLLLLAALVWVPQWTPERGRTISAINVTMVSLKDAPPGAPGPASPSAPAPRPAPTPAPAPVPAPAPAPLPKPVSPPKEAVSIAPAKPKAKAPAPKPDQTDAKPKKPPEVKKPPKPETQSPASAVARAIADLKENIDTARPAAVDAAIERLKAAEGPDAAIERLKAQAGEGGGGGGGGGGPLSIEDIYRLEVAYMVNKNWAFSESLTGGRSDLFAEVAFTVLPDGQIRDVWFDRRSGNSYLDESAKRAILKSNPLAPHPKGVRRPYITVGLRFTPKGVLQ